ncbi:amidohydrolase [Alkalitalea saponilacus]|uniref:Omega-amidase YafV n=1 Tax=Alkalitalea saponilacus TaxID=889453 RepID=A0A1T5D7J0_9BACT|nr:amidohydrolase [Alkalitalea saponilacus]ASB50602.1 amidohydrolase [Alkalitalea saponilacus]SKB67470.1 Carbon-nitrogen hydrolase [Alkalitalea saponilacus]
MNEELKVSLVQHDIKWEQIEVNLERIQYLIQNNKFESRVIVLPEMFATGFSMKPHKTATTMRGVVFNWLKKLSDSTNAIVIGSLPIVENNRYYNRCIAMYPGGNLFWYDKKHLFRMSGEEKVYSSGDKRVIINVDGWRIALFICYDLRFPVWCRNRNDYDVAIYVANWPKTRSYIWKTLLSARAIENQCYVIGSNRVGKDPVAEYEGASTVFGFDGRSLNRTILNKEAIINTTLDFKSLYNFRNKFPTWMDADNFYLNA